MQEKCWCHTVSVFFNVGLINTVRNPSVLLNTVVRKCLLLFVTRIKTCLMYQSVCQILNQTAHLFRKKSNLSPCHFLGNVEITYLIKINQVLYRYSSFVLKVFRFLKTGFSEKVMNNKHLTCCR